MAGLTTHQKLLRRIDGTKIVMPRSEWRARLEYPGAIEITLVTPKCQNFVLMATPDWEAERELSLYFEDMNALAQPEFKSVLWRQLFVDSPPADYQLWKDKVDEYLREHEDEALAYCRPSASLSAFDAQDIDTINRHRRRLGTAEIDLSAGWSAKEIADMADTIRRHGRTHNPALAQNPKALKRRLTS